MESESEEPKISKFELMVNRWAEKLQPKREEINFPPSPFPSYPSFNDTMLIPRFGLQFENPLDRLIHENLIGRGVLSLVMGFGFGSLLGIVFSGASAIDFDPNLSTRQKILMGFKESFKNGYSQGKTFAKIGAIFAVSEGVIEKYRAKEDHYNGLGAGCFTGAAVAWRGGPITMALGCGGFAIFSFLIDRILKPADPRLTYMRDTGLPKHFRNRSLVVTSDSDREKYFGEDFYNFGEIWRNWLAWST